MFTTITASDIPIKLDNNCHKLVKPGKLYQLLRSSTEPGKTEIWDEDITLALNYEDINCPIYEGLSIVNLGPDGFFLLIEAKTTALGVHYVDEYTGSLDPVFHILASGGQGWLTFSERNICAKGYYFREVIW